MNILNLIEKICIPFCLLILTIWQCFIQHRNHKLEERKFINEKRIKLFDKRYEFLEHFKQVKYNLFLRTLKEDNKNYQYLEESIKELYHIIKKSEYLFNYHNEKFFIKSILLNIFDLEEKERLYYSNKNKKLQTEIKLLKDNLSNNCDKLINAFEKHLILEDEDPREYNKYK